MTLREQNQQEYEILKGLPELLQECISRICTPDPCMQALWRRLHYIKENVEEIIEQGPEELHNRFLHGMGER